MGLNIFTFYYLNFILFGISVLFLYFCLFKDKNFSNLMTVTTRALICSVVVKTFSVVLKVGVLKMPVVYRSEHASSRILPILNLNRGDILGTKHISS